MPWCYSFDRFTFQEFVSSSGSKLPYTWPFDVNNIYFIRFPNVSIAHSLANEYLVSIPLIKLLYLTSLYCQDTTMNVDEK